MLCVGPFVMFTLYFPTAAEQVERAFNLALAAILGKGVYNFGELVSFILNNLNLCQDFSKK